jgi:hypothetical protein
MYGGETGVYPMKAKTSTTNAVEIYNDIETYESKVELA